MVTDEQVRLLRRKLMENQKKETAAAAAGMSVRAAQKWQRGALPSQAKKPRTWRPRRIPSAKWWRPVVVRLLRAANAAGLKATRSWTCFARASPASTVQGTC